MHRGSSHVSCTHIVPRYPIKTSYPSRILLEESSSKLSCRGGSLQILNREIVLGKRPYLDILRRDPAKILCSPINILRWSFVEKILSRGLAQTLSRILCTNLAKRSFQEILSRDRAHRSCQEILQEILRKDPVTIHRHLALILLEILSRRVALDLQRFDFKRSCRGVTCCMLKRSFTFLFSCLPQESWGPFAGVFFGNPPVCSTVKPSNKGYTPFWVPA